MTVEELENLILETVAVKLEPVEANGMEFARAVLDVVSVHKAARMIAEAQDSE